MRLERIASAVAIILVGATAAAPGSFAASSPTATIVSPADGEIVSATSTVTISYSGYSAAAKNISGYLMLDGEAAGTFTKRVSSPNGTTFDARLAGAPFGSGLRTLTARVFTELDNPVDTPPVSIELDVPPVISDLSYSYDLDARALEIQVTVVDDHGDSLVRFATGANNTTHLVDGMINVTLPAARGEGTYNATIDATDGWNHTTRTTFQYTVGDREASILISNVAYRTGGWLNLSGVASDPDGLSFLSVHTPLGNASHVPIGNDSSWLAVVRLQPRLGTFEGSVVSHDRFGGTTSVPFTFTIEGTRETFFERQVDTSVGGHADYTGIFVPDALEARIEICVGPCGWDAPALAVNGSYSIVCGPGQSSNPPCRALTGRPVTAGQLAICEGGSTVPPFSTIANATRTVDEFGQDSPVNRRIVCWNYYENDINGTEPSAGVSVRTEGIAIVAQHGNSTEPGTCASFGEDRACPIDAREGDFVRLAWEQGPMRSVTVRVTGVRV